MIINTYDDFLMFENHMRLCLGCESNFCAVLRSRPYRLFRLQALGYLDGSNPTFKESKVFFFLSEFSLHVYPMVNHSIGVDIDWSDVAVYEDMEDI